MMGLPSLEEYMKKKRELEETIDDLWDKELFRCPQCNGGMKKDYSIAYLVNPPKYRYFCKGCGNSIIM